MLFDIIVVVTAEYAYVNNFLERRNFINSRSQDEVTNSADKGSSYDATTFRARFFCSGLLETVYIRTNSQRFALPQYVERICPTGSRGEELISLPYCYRRERSLTANSSIYVFISSRVSEYGTWVVDNWLRLEACLFIDTIERVDLIGRHQMESLGRKVYHMFWWIIDIGYSLKRKGTRELELLDQETFQASPLMGLENFDFQDEGLYFGKERKRGGGREVSHR